MTKILFYFNTNSSFYTNLFTSIKKGFEENNCIVRGKPYLISNDNLREEIMNFSPDFVLEINRTKSEIEGFPKHVIHVSWIFDLWDSTPKNLYSDIIYTFGYDWLKIFPKSCAKYIACLPPATDTDIFKPLNTKPHFDFSFFGHIPKPWNEQELNRVVGYRGKNPIYFKDIIKHIETALLSKFNPYLADDNLFSFESFQKKHQFEFSHNLTTELKYDITTRIFRQKNRLKFLSKISKTNKNISIFGTNWECYKNFSKYYKGYIESPSELNKAIQRSNIMLHDNHNLHFRILDAMACGTPVTVTTPRAQGDNLERYGFFKNIHYLEVNLFEDKIFTSPPKKQLNAISLKAMRLVNKKHLWRHRAKKILSDVLKLEE